MKHFKCITLCVVDTLKKRIKMILLLRGIDHHLWLNNEVEINYMNVNISHLHFFLFLKLQALKYET